MPIYSLMLFVFSLCNMALPLTPNFVGEFLCLCSVFAHHLGALVGALIAVVLSAAYTMWAYARVVHGMPKPQYFHALADLNRREVWTLLPLLAVALWWGIKPGMVLDQLSSSLWFWQQATYAAKSNVEWMVTLFQDSILFNPQNIDKIHLDPSFRILINKKEKQFPAKQKSLQKNPDYVFKCDYWTLFGKPRRWARWPLAGCKRQWSIDCSWFRYQRFMQRGDFVRSVDGWVSGDHRHGVLVSRQYGACFLDFCF